MVYEEVVRAFNRTGWMVLGGVALGIAGIATLVVRCAHGGMNIHSGSGASGTSGGRPDMSGPVSDVMSRSIVDGLRTQLGVEVSGVRCADGRCAAVMADGGQLPISIHGDDWELGGLVIASAPLEAYVVGALADLGVTARVDCGPRVRAAQIGDRVACALDNGGRAFATIRDGAGAFTLELAIDREAAAARQGPADVAALDRQSAALDRGGDAVGEGGDESAAGEDGGAGGAATDAGAR